jgi:DNA-binding MarR family transcriptional regulator
MASTFFPKNFPRGAVLKDLARRYPDLKPAATEAFLVFLRVASDVRAYLDARMARHGMSQGKFCLLMQLNQNPESGMSPSELADRVAVSRATVTGLVDGLEREGLIRRERSPRDRRSLALRLTPAGRHLLDRMLPGHYRRAAKLMARLNNAEKKNLVSLLQKVAEGLKDAEKVKD